MAGKNRQKSNATERFEGNFNSGSKSSVRDDLQENLKDNLTDNENSLFCVVVNAEKQYSYWFVDRPLPAGWESTGFVGSRSECLAEVDNIWTDMRPLSVQKAVDTGVT